MRLIPFLLACGLAAGCSHQTREETISVSLASMATAEASYLAYEEACLETAVKAATTVADGQARIDACKASQPKVVAAFEAANVAIKAADVANNDPTLSKMKAALSGVVTILSTLGVTL